MFGFKIDLSAAAGAPSHGPTKRKRSDGAGTSVWSRNNRYLEQLRSHLSRNGDYEAAEKAIAAQTDVNDRSYVIEACADWSSPPTWISAWSAARPDSGAMFLVSGMSGLISAWARRGTGWTPTDIHGFVGGLRTADVLISPSRRRNGMRFVRRGSVGIHDLCRKRAPTRPGGSGPTLQRGRAARPRAYAGTQRHAFDPQCKMGGIARRHVRLRAEGRREGARREHDPRAHRRGPS